MCGCDGFCVSRTQCPSQIADECCFEAADGSHITTKMISLRISSLELCMVQESGDLADGKEKSPFISFIFLILYWRWVNHQVPLFLEHPLLSQVSNNADLFNFNAIQLGKNYNRGIDPQTRYGLIRHNLKLRKNIGKCNTKKEFFSVLEKDAS